MKNSNLYTAALISTLLAFNIEILPIGAVLHWGYGNTTVHSYFSLRVFGFGNFSPFITGVCTVVIFVLLALKKCKKGVATWTLIACVISIYPLIYGADFMNMYSYAVSVLLLISGICQCLHNKVQKINLPNG